MTKKSKNNVVTSKAEETKGYRLPVEKILPPNKVLDVNYLDVEVWKLNEIAQVLRLPEGLDAKEKNNRIVRALELFESLKPLDSVEGMLAAQMVGAHYAVLECLRMAAVPEQTFEAKDMYMKHAQKLMSLYTQQVAALDKHRGKGQQKVTVEHVTVQSGGQAIVGNVEKGSGKEIGQAPQLEDNKELPIDMSAEKSKASK